MNRFQIYEICLPESCVMPSDNLSEPANEEFVARSSSADSGSEADRRVIFICIAGHQLLFQSLNIATYVAQQAIRAAKADNPDLLASLIRSAAILRLGHASMTCAAANMARTEYESCIRPMMAKASPDFSGLSSVDNWIFQIKISELKEVISARTGLWNGLDADCVLRALNDYKKADKVWWGEHGRIMHTLISGDKSLAQTEYKNQVEHGLKISFGDFREGLRRRAVLDEYDRFFSLRRGPVRRSQFRYNLKWIIAQMDQFQDERPALRDYWKDAVTEMFDVIDHPTGSQSVGHALPDKGVTSQSL